MPAVAMGKGHSRWLHRIPKAAALQARNCHRRSKKAINLFQRITAMNSKQFVNQLTQISFPDVFNPYRDLCIDHDSSEGPAIRRLNLWRYLDAAEGCGIQSV